MQSKYKRLLHNHYLKNRTIVSADILPFLQEIAYVAESELFLHRYPSGDDIGTWIVPPQWDVNEAWLKGPDGQLIASYSDHPLFAVPYTQPFSGTVDLQTLKEHVLLHPKLDNAFYYEHRFAYDFNQRLSDWAITLPRQIFNSLSEGNYHVHLDFEIKEGEMLIGELCLPGETDDSIALLTDYCHPGQVNDSFSGILAMLDVFDRLKSLSSRKYTYRFFLFPETIGSCVLLHSRPDYIRTIKLAVFSEFVGWGRNWKVLSSCGDGMISEKIGREIESHWTDVTHDELFAGFGNDEIVFDYAGIPSMSVQMTECDEYHSSLDSPKYLEEKNLTKAGDIIYRICQIMEMNENYKHCQKVPVYLTRFDLYEDAINSPENFIKNRAILYGIKDQKSILDIAWDKDINLDYINDYVNLLKKHKLIERNQ